MIAKAWKGDMLGGAISSVMGLSKAVPLGILVFASLGPDYMVIGAFAGMIAIIFANLGSATTRGAAILNSGPFTITSLMLASAVPVVLGRTGLGLHDPKTIALVVELIFLTVFLSGLFQVLFGLLKIGALTKYIPFPVIAGLMNGTGIAIIFAQLGPMMGLNKGFPLHDVAAAMHNLSLPNLCIGGLTLLLLWQGDKLTRRIPRVILGLIAGTALFHLMKAWGGGQNIGQTIGTIPGGIPTPEHLIYFLDFLFRGERLNLLADILPIAVSIAIVNSLRTLIVATAVDSITCERTDANRELIGQGVGNMLSGVFGGISSAGSNSTTIPAFRSGASTAASKLYSGLFSLLVLLVLTPVVSLLPQVVLSALLLMVGVEALDSWSIKLLFNAFFKRESRQEYIDILIVFVVAGISIFIGPTEALAAGIVISVVHFIYRMGKDILSREYDATFIRSNIIRPMAEIEFLEKEGDRIRVLELQGVLFFGTTDKLAEIIDVILGKDDGRIQYIILNFRKVSEMDASGANIIGQIRKRCEKKGIQVWICSSDQQGMGQRIKAYGIHGLIKGIDWHESISAALGCAEDKLLDAVFGAGRNLVEKRLDEISMLSAFQSDELQILSGYLKRSCFDNAAVVYQQGSAGDSLYFILKGRAKIEFASPRSTSKTTIAILCPGMMFGEMAIIDGSSRSAGIVAEGELVCVSITVEEISALLASHPDMIKRLYRDFAMNLVQRLRITNRINSELQA